MKCATIVALCAMGLGTTTGWSNAIRINTQGSDRAKSTIMTTPSGNTLFDIKPIQVTADVLTTITPTAPSVKSTSHDPKEKGVLAFNGTYQGSKQSVSYGIAYTTTEPSGGAETFMTQIDLGTLPNTGILQYTSTITENQSASYAWYYTIAPNETKVYSTIYTYTQDANATNIRNNIILYLNGDRFIDNMVAQDEPDRVVPVRNGDAVYASAPAGRGSALDLNGSWWVNAGRPHCVKNGDFTLGLWFCKQAVQLNDKHCFFGTQDWTNEGNLGFSVHENGLTAKSKDYKYTIAPYYTNEADLWQYLTIVVTRRGSDISKRQTITLYKDGVKFGEEYYILDYTWYSTADFIASGMNLLFGASGKDNPTYASNSYQDEIALWSRALSADEVSELYTTYGGVLVEPFQIDRKFNYTTTLEDPTATWDTIQWQNGGQPVATPVSFAYTTLDIAVPTSTSLDIGETPSVDQAALKFTGTGDLTLSNPSIPASYNFAGMTGKATLNSATGSATITAGTDTVLTQGGRGRLTVEAGKKITLPASYQVAPFNYAGTIVSHGVTLKAVNANTFKGSGKLELVENTNTTIDGSQVDFATAITQSITGAGNLTFKARGNTADAGAGDAAYGTITNAAGCSGTLTIAKGLLDISQSGYINKLPTGNIILAGGGLTNQNVDTTITKNVEIRGGESYIRSWNSDHFELTFSGSLSGSEDATLRQVDGGHIKLTGDLSTYLGKIDTRRGSGPIIVTTVADESQYMIFPGSLHLDGSSSTGASTKLELGRDLTLSGIISGPFPLVKNGSAKVTLTGTNTLTGAIQVNGGTLQSSTQSLGVAPVSLATGALAFNIDLTEAEHTALTTENAPMVKLCATTGGINTFENKTSLYYNGALINLSDHAMALRIIDQTLYAVKDRTNAQLISTVENANWTTAPWLDDLGHNIYDWTQQFGFLTITAPATGEASLILNQNVNADYFLTLRPSEDGTGTLTIRQDANAYTLTMPNIDASTTTHTVTLDYNTGASNISVGADTILPQAGTGTLTVGPNKKATLSAEGWTGEINLAGTPNSTNLATLNASTSINVPVFTTSGPFALATNQGQTFTITDVASASQAQTMNITGEGTVKLATMLTRTSQVIVNEGATLDISQPEARLFNNLYLLGSDTLIVTGTLLTRDWEYGSQKSLGELRHNNPAVKLDGGTVVFTETFESGRSFTITAKGVTFSANEGVHFTKKAAPPIINVGAPFTFTGAGGGTFPDAITGTNVSITKQGIGSWTLSGENTYTGATNIEAGTLKIPLAQVAPTTVKTGATLAFLTGGTSGKAQMVTVEDNVTIDLSALGDEDTILGGFQLSEGVISANVNINVTGRTLVEGQTLLTWDAANVIPAGLTAILTGASDPTFFIKKVNNSLRVSKVNIVITGGDISQNVMDYLARNLTESITLTQAQANMLYLFQLPITQEALTFKVNDIQVVKGEGEAYSVIVTATLNGITLTETHNVNGSFQLLAGISPNSMASVVNHPTDSKTLTNGSIRFEVPLSDARCFKIRITDTNE